MQLPPSHSPSVLIYFTMSTPPSGHTRGATAKKAAGGRRSKYKSSVDNSASAAAAAAANAELTGSPFGTHGFIADETGFADPSDHGQLKSPFPIDAANGEMMEILPSPRRLLLSKTRPV